MGLCSYMVFLENLILSHVRVTGLVIGFAEHLQVVTTRNYSAIANSHTLQFTTVRTSFLSLLCLHQSLPGDGSQQRPLLSYSHSYRLATVAQLTHCSNCPAYNISARITHKTPFLCCCIYCWVRVCWDAHLIAIQPLPSNTVVYKAIT
jgi:hypothetical protein